MPLTFANKVTIARILIVPFFISTVLYYLPERDYLRFWALGLFMLATITDFIDGYIARTRHQKTKAGALLDPLADKILLISAFICLYKISIYFKTVQFPIWLVVAVISRDVILLTGCTIIHLVHGELNGQPTFYGKATTFFQVLSIIGLLLQWPNSIYLWVLTIFFAIISTIDYIKMGIKILNAGQTLVR